MAELKERVSEQTDVVALTTSSLACAARSRGMTEEQACHFIERAVRPLNEELAGLEELLHEALEWERQVQGRRAQACELRRLVETACERQEALTDYEKARLVELLDVRATVLKAPPPNKGGTPCAVAQWFADRGRKVPQPTVDGWRRLAVHLPALRQESVRCVLRKATEGASWTAFENGVALRQCFRRWLASGAWGRAMDILADQPTAPLPSAQAPLMDVRINLAGLGLDPGGEA